jgi:hypothetical protein
MGVDLLDLTPPPESSPTVGGGTIFWLNWGSTVLKDGLQVHGLPDNGEMKALKLHAGWSNSLFLNPAPVRTLSYSP